MRRVLCLGAALAALFAGAAGAQAPGLGGAVELVDPHTLRVCADPQNLPFSDTKGAGFENKIADLLGRKLHEPVAYTYYPQVIGFYRNTLNAFRCDVVIGVVQGLDLVMTTLPYYHTSYALVFKPGHGLDGVSSLEDPRLKGKRLGVVARTPPATLMVRDGLMDNARPYPLTVDTRVEAPGKTMIDDLVADRIDAAVLWGPIAGFDAIHAGQKLTVVPLLSERGAPMDFRISMGVRRGDREWRRRLNRLITENRDAIDRILVSYGVPLLDEQGKPVSP
ncbi:MAG: quinoprotein dehydrogenase-associated putative ABC transporter substrate-binding protein [Rhodospirillales bacterium]|nr:quinoprotein dehydrogenase-associated putative ABC transporter substrate-binding protein [Rhodospirillales bacterium]